MFELNNQFTTMSSNMGENNDLVGMSSTNLDLFQPDDQVDDEALILEGNLTSSGPMLAGGRGTGLGVPGSSEKSGTAPFNTPNEPIRDTI